MASPELDIYDSEGMFSSEKVARIYEESRSWPSEQKAAILSWLESAATRERIKRQYANAAEIAAAVDPDYRITPALSLIATAIEQTLSKPRHNLLITMSPQEGKALCGTVPLMALNSTDDILTPAKFITMEDIQPGDFVFHPDGKPVEVLAKTPAQHERPLYRVTTSDGRTVIADAEHAWTVSDQRRSHSSPSKARIRGGPWETLTTTELLTRGLLREKPRVRRDGGVSKGYAFKLPRQHPVTSPDADLPIPPYLLGLWLADGNKRAAEICEGHQDAATLAGFLRDDGVNVYALDEVESARGRAVIMRFRLGERGRFRRIARELGVLDDKDIPDLYLTAGTQQRLDLLRGLLDGDGAISTNGNSFRVEYSSCIEKLAKAVLFLVRSLGWRATCKESGSTLDGVAMLPRFRVTFTPVRGEFVPFRLPRKADRIQEDKSRAGERHTITISSIEPVTPGTAYCIQVDSPDGLFLAGRDLIPTHNSSLCAIWAPIRAWQLNPNRRVILASYGDDLAHTHSANCRSVIESHGTGVTDPMTGARVEDKLGLKLSTKSRRIDAWRIDGGKGGMVAVGLGSAITGRAADLFIIDDPYKNMQEADSSTHREKVDMWMASVAMTRLSPEASMILVQTRWNVADLAGKVMAAEAELPPSQRTWRYLNIPAISEDGVPDALNRPPGTVMISARGRTRAEFEQTRRSVGERVWYALYQGMPTNPAGGLFERAWFDPSVEYPINPVAAVVAVDPADSGEGDETGIISAFLNPDGSIVFAHDDSGMFTSEQWSTKAVERALSIGAREIALEGFATYTTYAAVVKHAYTNIHKKAREDLAVGKTLTSIQQRALSPTSPFMVTKWTAGGDAVGRAAGLRQALEIKRARVVPYEMSVFIEQSADWQPGQHCPDRVAAAVIAHDRLDKLGSGMLNYASPLHRGGRDTPSWLTRRISDGGGVGR